MFAAEPAPIRLITLDPGHFHAALVQKEMYPGVSPRVTVYAPLGFDLTQHLERVARFNLRAERPAAWELDIHTSNDPLGQMLREKAAESKAHARDGAGNVVVIAGRNRPKIDRIQASVNAGMNVLSDKPWVIRSADLSKVAATLDAAEKKSLVAYDLMTERYEATNYIQRELVNDPVVFGQIVPGDAQNPGVYMESVHYLMKTVAGVPNLRPAWFFDIQQQGEGLADVGTHLVDLAAWTISPLEPPDYRKDIRVLAAKRWPTVLSKAEFQRVTGEPLKTDSLEYFCNNQVSYTVRGVHVKLDVLWKYESPTGLDTHLAIYRGSKSRIEVRQGELYVSPRAPEVLAALKEKVAALQGKYPGIAVEDRGNEMQVTIPDRYRTGHESHFAQVTNRFLEYLKDPKSMPAWETTNMLAKYYVTTKGVEFSHPQ